MVEWKEVLGPFACLDESLGKDPLALGKKRTHSNWTSLSIMPNISSSVMPRALGVSDASAVPAESRRSSAAADRRTVAVMGRLVRS